MPKRIPYKPWPYQKKAIKFLLGNPSAMLLLDPGLGKTSITLAACKVLKNEGQFKGALVFAPLRPVYSVWPNERDKWKEFEGFSVGILHGPNKEKVLEEDHDFYFINFEGMEWLLGNVDRRRKILSKVDTLVIDELSKMKHSNTKRFKLLKPYLGKFARRWGLTGSPASNGLMDLFGQCYVIDMGRALGPFITHYRNKYFYQTGYGGYTWALQEGAEEKIHAAIKPMSLRMDADDYLQLPTIIPVPVYVELPPKARAAYEEMEEELFTMIDGQEFVAVAASAAGIKCEQIANGALYMDKVDPLTGLPMRGKREWVELHTAKLDALAELVDELQGQPCLIGYHFGHDLERIIKTRGKNTPYIGLSSKNDAKLISAWNKNELPELYGHPAGMAHGLNMQEGHARHVGFFHVPYDLELYMQFIRRVRRQGNDAKQVFVYHFIARNTVDEVKMVRLSGKAKTEKSLLDALKSYRREKRNLS